MTAPRTSRRRFFAHIFGGMLAACALGILLMLGLFFIAKYTQPSSLAELLPAESTLLYADIKTDAARVDARQLAELFGSADAATLFDIDALGFTDATDFLALLGRRTSVAYLGNEFDTQRFVFVADVPDRAGMRDYLATQTLAGEELHESLYLGYPVLSWPRSRSLTASFIGNDLVLAADETLLRDILETTAGLQDSLANSASFVAVQARANRQALGFGYISKNLTDQLLLRQLGGLDYAIAVPLLDSFVGAGVELSAEQDGLRMRVSFVLNDTAARAGVFQTGSAGTASLTDLLGEEVARFVIGQDVAGDLAQVFTAIKKERAHEVLLAEGYLNNETQRVLGTDFNQLQPLLAGESLLGETRTGGWFAAFAGAGMPTAFATLQESALAGGGVLLAGQERWRLPDDSTGMRLTAGTVRETSFESDGVMITHLQARGSADELYTAELADTVLVASEREQIEKMISRAVAAETGAFTQLVAASGLSSDAVFFRHMDSQIPQLRPFRYLLASLSGDAAALELTYFFGI